MFYVTIITNKIFKSYKNMYMLIILPKAFQWDECHDIIINTKVPFSNIFTIEDTLKNLNKSLLNLVEEIQNLLFKYKQNEFLLEKVLSEYVIQECDVIKKLKEGEETYEKVRSELKEYKFLTKSTELLDDFKNDMELVFLDCFCVMCESDKEKSLITALKKLGLEESSEKIKSDKLNVYYRVYCIKSETSGIIESINNSKKYFKCMQAENINKTESKENSVRLNNSNKKCREQDNKNENCNENCNNDNVINIIKKKQDFEFEYVDFLVKKANDVSKAYLNTLFAKGCVESMQRYGTSTCLKYKIIKIKEKKWVKYCKKIVKELHAQEIIEEISDEEEYPFTQHVIFKKAEEAEK